MGMAAAVRADKSAGMRYVVTGSRTLAALLAATMLTLAGCGESNRDEIESVVKRFDTALADGAGEKACERLSESARAEVERRGSCEALASRLIRPGRRVAREVKALRFATMSNLMVEDTVATAKVQAPGGYPPRSVELVEEAGGWRISETPLGP
jgi:hypothetical protein